MRPNNYNSFIIYNVPVLYYTIPQPQQIIYINQPSSILMNTPTQIPVLNIQKTVPINRISTTKYQKLQRKTIQESKNNNNINTNKNIPPRQSTIFSEYKSTSKVPVKQSQINYSNNKSIDQKPKEIKKLKKFKIDPNNTLMGKNINKAMPVYNLIRQGKGISRVEEQGIVFCAMTVYQEEMEPLSNNTARYIKKKLGGDWLVIVYPDEKKADFFLSSVSRNDFMYFTLDRTAYQVCRLR